MIQLGDITKICGYGVEPVDVVVGGSPCQDASVAGNRAGLSGERSGLYMDQIRVIKEMRDADIRRGRTDQFIRPRIMAWENVPGFFSVNKGKDFKAILEEAARVTEENAVIPEPPNGKWRTAGCILGDGWSIAWRVLDAQFWGVPQRRRRIALIADFGGQAAPEILFVRKSVCRDFAQSRETRERASTGVAEGFDPAICIAGNIVNRAEKNGGNGIGYQYDISYTLTSTDRHVVYDARGNGDGNTVPTMTGDHNGRITDYSAIVIEQASDRNFVRRLTPLECDRLQAFPDHWTDIGAWRDSKGKLHKESSDSARYKALGNSIALPPWVWVMKRICACYERPATLGSFFDGIGGFPLIWERLNGRGTCRWSSEIEEFPMAVTRYHFGGGS